MPPNADWIDTSERGSETMRFMVFGKAVDTSVAVTSGGGSGDIACAIGKVGVSVCETPAWDKVSVSNETTGFTDIGLESAGIGVLGVLRIWVEFDVDTSCC
ncbi:hypothetical protein [Candidatus Vallotia lariciata]|uniref:hypothetical protein n=1 Tax=Candidatus Vallotia laricis TaxID=2018052 RepID=UPI001D001E7F|nr:hypothetical protein [Candidatus Vallotia lariciata]